MDFTHKIFRFFSHPGDTRCKNCNYLKLMHPYEGTPQPCPLMLPPAVRRTDEEQARALAPSPLPPSLPPAGVPSLRPRLRSFAVFSVRPSVRPSAAASPPSAAKHSSVARQIRLPKSFFVSRPPRSPHALTSSYSHRDRRRRYTFRVPSVSPSRYPRWTRLTATWPTIRIMRFPR